MVSVCVGAYSLDSSVGVYTTTGLICDSDGGWTKIGSFLVANGGIVVSLTTGYHCGKGESTISGFGMLRDEMSTPGDTVTLVLFVNCLTGNTILVVWLGWFIPVSIILVPIIIVGPTGFTLVKLLTGGSTPVGGSTTGSIPPLWFVSIACTCLNGATRAM